MNYLETQTLYIFIYLITTFFAYVSQRKVHGRVCFRPFPLFLSFLIHWFFLSFTNIGADYYHYEYSIVNATLSSILEHEEIGFNIISHFFYVISNSSDIAIFFVKTIEICILYYGFYRIRYRCDLWLAVFAFNSLVYLQSFLLLSMTLGIVTIFLSFIILLEGFYIKSFIIFLLSCTFHNSCLLLFPTYLLCLFLNANNKRISVKYLITFVIIVIIIFMNFETIFEFALGQIPAFEHYAQYNLISKYEGSGLAQIIYFLPLFYFAFILYYSSFNNSIKNISVIFTCSAFIYAMLGYKLEVLARINMNFLGLYSVLIPIVLFSQRNCTIYFKRRLPYTINYLFWITVMIIRSYYIFKTNMNLDSETDIYCYEFFNPFK